MSSQQLISHTTDIVSYSIIVFNKKIEDKQEDSQNT